MSEVVPRPGDGAVIGQPDHVAQQLRQRAPSVLGRDDSAWASVVPWELAGHSYTIAEAYYHAVDEELRCQLTPVQVTVGITHPVFIGEVSHWYLRRSDGVVIDLTREQFEVMGIDVPYPEGRGRGFVPPSPSAQTRELLEAIERP